MGKDRNNASPTLVGFFYPFPDHGGYMKNRSKVQSLVVLSLFAALAYVAQFVVHIRIAFLTFDPKDAIITVAAMIYGPIGGVSLSFVVALLEAITNGSTGFWGALMNFCGSAAFSVTASLVYRSKRSSTSAVVGLVASVVSTTAVMLGANLLITPIYTGSTTSEVAAMLPTLLLPFNLVKALFNAGIVFLIYKPVVKALRSARLVPEQAHTATKNRATLTLAFGVLFVALAIVGILLLNGTLSFF